MYQMDMNLSTIYKNQALRYCMVGGMNTLVTAFVIITLTALGCGLYLWKVRISGEILLG